MADYMYVGSFGGQTGICVYSFDRESGRAAFIESVFPEINVGHALVDKERGLIYVVNESPTNPAFRFGGGGEVYALKIDGASGRLSLLDKSLSYGAQPTYSAFDRRKRHLIVPHFAAPLSVVTKVERGAEGEFRVVPVFSDSNTVLLSLKENGAFGGVPDVYTHQPESGYSENPHLHSVNLSPLFDLFAVCDMGTDKVYLFKIEDEKLIPVGNTPLQLSKGCGPRYSAFHPTKPYLFINCERQPLVKSFRYDENGNLTEICSASVLSDGMEADPHFNPSGVSLSADGKYFYVLVRGANLVSVFETDSETGAVRLLQSYKLKGDGPRGCCLTPDGGYLAVANKVSGTVEILKVLSDGTLAEHSEFSDPSPGVVAFAEC